MSQVPSKINWGWLILGIVLISVGAFVVVLQAGRYTYDSLRSQTWPSVVGKVTHSTVVVSSGRTHGYTYRAEVTFDYVVNDQHLAGNTVFYGCCGGDQSEQVAIAQRYPVSSTVPVYYDPENTQNSVLERGLHLEPLSVLFLVGIGIMLGGMLCVQRWKRKT